MASVVNSAGIKHPNTFSISQGNTLLSKYLNSINQSISLILRTAKGELFGDPDFGSNLYTYIYDIVENNKVIERTIAEDIVDSINKYETRAFVETSGISFEYEDTTVKINIRYNLRYTDYTTEYQYTINLKEE